MFVIVGDSILWNKYTKELTASELQTSGMGQFCFLLHQYILGMVAVWTLVINTYLRKEELRKCKYFNLQMYPDHVMEFLILQLLLKRYLFTQEFIHNDCSIKSLTFE